MIEWILLLLTYLGAGFTLKLGDDFLDDFAQPNYAWMLFALSGLLFGILMAKTQWDLLLFSAIIIGVLASGKVNKPQFSIGFIMIGLVLAMRGIPTILHPLKWLLLLGFLLSASVVDERGNDWADKQETIIGLMFFKYRFTLKIVVVILSLWWPEFWSTALGLWIFDAGYEIAGAVGKRLFRQRF